MVSYELNEENAPANYVAHEDFHTYAAKEIVKKCAEVAAERTGEPCLEAGDATVAILEDLMQKAQGLSDEMCNNCNYENNRAYAREAVKIAVNEFLNSWASCQV